MPDLDDFLGQVMAAMTRQLGALSSTLRVRNFEQNSTLRVRNFEQNTMALEIVFQEGRVMSPAEARYPASWRTVAITDARFADFLRRRRLPGMC